MADQASQMRSLRDVASRINSGGDLDTVLRDLIRAACEHGGWALGSIMAIDAAHGEAHVIVRHDPTLLRRPLENRWELATSPALIALQRNEPVYIRDARASDEFPGYRREAFERDYRTVLVLPMSCFDAQGRPMVLNVVSRGVTDVSGDDLAFMSMIVHLGGIAVAREHQLRAQRLAAEQLQNALQTQTMLLQEVLSGGSTAALSTMLAGLLPDAILVVDFAGNALTASRSPVPLRYDDAAWQRALDGAVGAQIAAGAREAVAAGRVEPQSLHLDDGSQRTQIAARIEALDVDGQPVGALVIFPESGESAGDLQRLLLDSVKFALSVQMMRSVIRFRFETRTLTELFFEIVERRWRDADDIVQRGRRLGLALGTPARMIVVDFPDGPTPPADISVDCHHAVTRLARQMNLSINVIAVGGGLVCLVPEGKSGGPERAAKLAHRMVEVLRHSFSREPIVVLGGVCDGLESYPKEWERCWRMIRIARSFGRSGTLSAFDFGPMPMLIGAAESADVRSFVDGAIGTLIAHDRKHNTPYLATLAAYLREGCRAQACADAMGLHVTTLRYRLSRIQDLFGIDPETADKRFAIELAIRLHGVIESSEVTVA
ncbi:MULTISPECIES: helix-turn-helix domain-containing protein [unclassified Bosea (in: a-proteobacteria)]|uniref:helix-turn-helix domain-containing protein n=1 Tax=unclassified Bosea (in: a-proteobacteria) TaxID=2653178 RepID=UPI000F76134A|nr:MULTISPECIES: helix-turn-helix domain-containing protein [unclassified Bosea (in: a-proteobacteria)]AZO77031.1 PucR family transcriptional regulator [Bosea sp. Tri-49]RXT21877.1 PucR family transcriptional regulator [Bosea sp. Tri-39]RXT32216.1 PucR family transcriptional regulator [Bosea sp. Tri-54]